MKSNLTPRWIRVGLAFAGLLSLSLDISAQIRPLNYDTPSYIEVEVDEIEVYEGVTSITVNLARTGEFRVTTKVDYETLDQTATGGEDYKPVGGTLVFKPGEGFKSITLDLLTDRERETTETFQLKLTTHSANTLIMRDTVTVTIQEATVAILSAPTLNIAPVENGGIRLSWAAAENVSLERTLTPESSLWESVPNLVQTTDGISEVTERCSGQLYFYRLRRD